MPTVAFRAIRSRSKFVNAQVVRDELDKWLDQEVKPKLIKLHEKRVANWRTKVTFRARKYITTDSINVVVFPWDNKEIYNYVAYGTRPHVIRARKEKSLAFVWGGPGSYTPKTTPNGGYGGPGKASGKMHFPIIVNHPGIEARQFAKHIRKEYEAEFKREAEKVWRRAIRKL